MTGKPFVHGDPRAGRKRGAKNRLATQVLYDLAAIWSEPVSEGSDLTRGVAALRILSIEDPAKFATIYASLLPKDYTIHATADLADDQVDAMIERLSQELLLEHKIPPKELELRLPDDYHVQDN